MSRRKSIHNFRSPYIFNNSFEERKILGYLYNITNSALLSRKSHGIFKFTAGILGGNAVISILKKIHLKIPSNDVKDNIDFERWAEDNLSHHDRVYLLRYEIFPLIAKRIKKLLSHKRTDLEERIDIIKKTFKLTLEETETLIFFYLIETNSIVRLYLTDENDIRDYTALTTFKSHGYIPLGLKKINMVNVFLKGSLTYGDMLEFRGASIGIDDWCLAYLSGLGGKNLAYEFFTRENDSSLIISDYELAKDDLKTLDTLVKSKEGFNILFYGEQGTGKTSLTKTLAKTYGKDILIVKIPRSNEHNDRLRGIYATLNCADDNSLILIDEADEVLNTDKSFFFQPLTNKSWINDLLENHEKKIIWITNKYYYIHESTMRRFTFSIEFKKFSAKSRLRVLKNELKKRGLEHYFNEEDLKELSRNYSVNASGIMNAIHILTMCKHKDKEEVLQQIRSTIRNHEKIVSMKDVHEKKRRDFKYYSLQGLNCSENLHEIISIMERYIKLQETDQNKFDKSVSLLLYGMPGTGKSEFVYYLGYALGKEVTLRRASDIHSMWVGETEKNIAGAFREAKENSDILFFDEADTFLFPRKSAQRSWEISFTNEILTQLENHTGIVIFATNDIDGLDHASLRRFRFKIEFKTLTPEGNVHFYNTIFKSLVHDELTQDEVVMLRNIKNLTPGDFAVVKDQSLFVETSKITHQKLIGSLINEVKHKHDKTPIGFVK